MKSGIIFSGKEKKKNSRKINKKSKKAKNLDRFNSKIQKKQEEIHQKVDQKLNQEQKLPNINSPKSEPITPGQQEHKVHEHLKSVYKQMEVKQEQRKKEEEKGQQENHNQKDGEEKEGEGDDKSVMEKGHEDAIKEQIKEQDKNIEKFESLVEVGNEVLFETSSMFPFDLFPDKVTIMLTKVTIQSNEFFSSGRLHSIHIKDIIDVFVESGPIFSTLRIVDAGFVENSINVRRLRKKDALKARRIIQGLIETSKQDINISQLNNIPDFLEKLEKLGLSEEEKEKTGQVS